MFRGFHEESEGSPIKNDVHIGIDIGGTLAKVAVVAPRSRLAQVSSLFSDALMIHEKVSTEEHDIVPNDLGFIASLPSIELEFAMFSFSSRDISPLLEFLAELLAPTDAGSCIVKVTGGGSVKFRIELEHRLPHLELVKIDEIEAISTGFSFLVHRPGAAFIFKSVSDPRRSVPSLEVAAPFPLLLVNIGSGVSMIRIDGPGKYERVQGTPIGGGTVLGLGRALFGATTFEEIMELSMHGASSEVDVSVGELIGPPPDDDFWNYNTLASSLTKLNTTDLQGVSRADLAQSIVRMVSYNIGNIAFLVSCLNKCTRIYFSGKFVNKHIPTMEAISYAVKFYENWKPPPSAGSTMVYESPRMNQLREQKCEVRFLHHEGYVGAIGALIAR